MTMDDFTKRLSALEDEFHALYMELYDHEAAYQDLLGLMTTHAQNRPERLKAYAAEKDADWHKQGHSVGMLMYADRFAGTLEGVREKLDYLKDGGVNYLHLMPLLESPKERGDGGYAVSSYRKVNPELGTLEDLDRLTDDMHARGMSLCLDFVLNHTSEDHPWAKKARAGEKEYQDYYFVYDNWDLPNAYDKHINDVMGATAPGNFTYVKDMDKVVYTTFFPYQWDLNYHNPKVFNGMADNLMFLADHGVDVFRLDAIPHMWKEPYAENINLPGIHKVLRLFRIVVDIVTPGVLLLGEVNQDPDTVVTYFGTPDKPECHMLYNINVMASLWRSLACQDARLLGHQIDLFSKLPQDFTFLQYARCHDDIAWFFDQDFLKKYGISEDEHKKFLNDWYTGKDPASYARGELFGENKETGDARIAGTAASLCGLETALSEEAVALAIDRDVLIHAVLLFMTGIPVIYSGDEIGQLNDYTYHDDPVKAGDSRYLHRPQMNWGKVSDVLSGDAAESRLYKGIQAMGRFRQDSDFFASDVKVEVLETNEHLLAIKRVKGDDVLLGVFNFSAQPEALALTKDNWRDALAGTETYCDAITLAPYASRWLLGRA